MEKCKDCLESVIGNYCSNCGLVIKFKRIDRHHLFHEFQHNFIHFEKGLFFTLKELFLRPGIALRNFINGDRTKFYKPLGFLVIMSALLVLMEHKFSIKPNIIINDNANQNKFNDWVKLHPGSIKKIV